MVVGIGEAVWLFTQADDFFRQRLSAFAAFRPDFGEGDIDAQFPALFFDELQFRFAVGREAVDRYDTGQAEDLCDIFNMLKKIGKTLFQSFQVFVGQFRLGNTAVMFQCSDRCDDDDRIRS